jgi:hypothetical protein
MNIAIYRPALIPHLRFLMLGEKLDHHSAGKRMQNVGDEVGHKEKQSRVNHQGKRKIVSLENPANSNTSKTKLPAMLRKVSGVMLILLPKLLAFHRVCRPAPPSRVPGLFVGAGPGGGDDGGGVEGALLTGGADGAGALGCPDGLGVGADGLDIKFSVAKSPNEKS